MKFGEGKVFSHVCHSVRLRGPYETNTNDAIGQSHGISPDMIKLVHLGSPPGPGYDPPLPTGGHLGPSPRTLGHA